jgi:hypothetical protein
LYFTNNLLYWADSESSSIRVADFNRGVTRTVAGPLENNLFNFGDVDGVVGTSRLQHALAVTGAPDGTIYVADTYNSRIKALEPASNTLTSLFGQGSPGAYRDGGGDDAAFDEPGGLSYADGRLYVADTNNHAIRVIDLEAGTVETLLFPNPELLQIAGQTTVIGGNRADDALLLPDMQTVAAGAGSVTVTFTLPPGFRLNPDAPSRYEFNSAGAAVLIAPEDMTGAITALTLNVPAAFEAGTDTLFGLLEVYYCDAESETLCYIDRVRVEAEVTVAQDGGAASIALSRAIQPPDVG